MKSRVRTALILCAVVVLGAGCDRSSSNRKPANAVLEREAPVIGPIETALPGRQRPEGLNPDQARFLDEQEASWRELPNLLRRAEQGDMKAAAELGEYLVTCVTHPDAVASKQRFEQELADAKERERGDSSDVFTRTAKQNYASRLIVHEACSKLGDAQVANYHLWLEKAARAGVASAKSAYVASALKEFEGKGALVANIEEATRRRQIARAWMEEILRDKGNPGREERLRQYVAELNGQDNRLFAADQQKAITYQYVLDMAIALRTENSSRLAQLWKSGPDRYGDLSDQQWMQAAEEGRNIFTRDFGPGFQ